jgi:hypothetical protein
MSNNTGVIHFLLKHGANVNRMVSVENDSFVSPLRWNIHYLYDYETARLLLDHGAQVDKRGCQGMTPLMAVAVHKRGDLAIVWLLLKHGASVGARDDSNRTAISRMCNLEGGEYYRRVHIIRLLASYVIRETTMRIRELERLQQLHNWEQYNIHHCNDLEIYDSAYCMLAYSRFGKPRKRS